MPHYVNVASGSFYTGISEVVVVVGTKRFFVAMLLALWSRSARREQCAKHFKHSHKKYDS
jgi:hypothetical protein